MPLVSVIIPIYNGERYLRGALASVFAQTFCDYEVICIDDGSTDGSLAILQEYEGFVTVIRQPNAGQSAARNFGVRQSKGTYLAFLDQDDCWYPDKLEQQVSVLDHCLDVVLVHCDVDMIDGEGKIVRTGVVSADLSVSLTSWFGRLVGEPVVFPSAMMVRRDIFERVGMFDPELRGFEDIDLVVRLRQHGRFVLLAKSGLRYRVHGDAFSSNSRGAMWIIRSRERLLKRMQVIYLGDRDKEAIIDGQLADCYSDWGINEARNGQRRIGLSILISSLRLNPLKFRTYSRLLRSVLLPGFAIRHKRRGGRGKPHLR